LTDIQKDALQEIGNICSGNAATALSQLLNKKISIIVPKIHFIPIENVPEWMNIIMLGNPLTYAVDSLRGFLIGTFALPIYLDFLVILVVSGSLMLIGAFAFNRCECS